MIIFEWTINIQVFEDMKKNYTSLISSIFFFKNIFYYC